MHSFCKRQSRHESGEKLQVFNHQGPTESSTKNYTLYIILQTHTCLLQCKSFSKQWTLILLLDLKQMLLTACPRQINSSSIKYNDPSNDSVNTLTHSKGCTYFCTLQFPSFGGQTLVQTFLNGAFPFKCFTLS